MKGKTSLVLMEQAIMLLVLALAAALCLRVFAWADVRSQENAQRDQALDQLQSAAETLKAENGKGLEDGAYIVYFDADWKKCPAPGEFALGITPADSPEKLACAQLEVTRRDGKILGSLRVCWQEGTP